MRRQEFVAVPAQVYTAYPSTRAENRRCPHRRDIICNCANTSSYSAYTSTTTSPVVYTASAYYPYVQSRSSGSSSVRTVTTSESSSHRQTTGRGSSYSEYPTSRLQYTRVTPVQQPRIREVVYSDQEIDDSYRSSSDSYRPRSRSLERPVRSEESSHRHRHKHKHRHRHRSKSRDDSRSRLDHHDAYEYIPSVSHESDDRPQRCSHSTLDALMSGGLDPTDDISNRRRQRAGLFQDDFGLWHECSERSETKDTRRVHWPDELIDEDEDDGDRRRSIRYRTIRPTGFLEELDD